MTSTDHRTISIQPANTPSGAYDVNTPLPYPYHLIVPGEVDKFDPLAVDRQDFWQGDPERLVGFQRGDVQEVVLWPGDFVADPESAVGLRPVFTTTDGDMFTITNPIDSVSTHGVVTS
jgi:hypothetical protein